MDIYFIKRKKMPIKKNNTLTDIRLWLILSALFFLIFIMGACTQLI